MKNNGLLLAGGLALLWFVSGTGKTGAQSVKPGRRATKPAIGPRSTPTQCEYSTYAWSSRLGRAVDRRAVSKGYGEVSGEERSTIDPRCTICEGDQVWIDLPGVEPFRACWAHASSIETALLAAMNQGAVIEEVVGYRPGRTGGPLDAEGRRTELGSHAYGLALDVNPDQNGMYSGGQLRHGGEYRPDSGDPRTITRDSPIYRELTKAGFGWDGDRDRSFDDWMHFSYGD
jgi:hypothetical protein